MNKPTDEQKEQLRDRVMCRTQRRVERRCGKGGVKLIDELSLIAFSDLKNHVTIADGGELQALPLDGMGDNSRVVKKVKEKTIIAESKDGERLYKTSQIEYELHDKIDAIKELIVLGGFRPVEKKKHELDLPNGGIVFIPVKMSEQEWEERFAKQK